MRHIIITLLLVSAIVSMVPPIYVVAVSAGSRAFMAMNIVSATPLLALSLVVILRLVATSPRRVMAARLIAIIGILCTLFALIEGVSFVLQSWGHSKQIDAHQIGTINALIRNICPNVVIIGILLTVFLPWKKNEEIMSKRDIFP